MRNYYEVLGLPFGAPITEVRLRYRQLARLYHPDVNPDPEAEEKMRLLNEAYRVLSDPQLRLQYHLRVALNRARVQKKTPHRVAYTVPVRPVPRYVIYTLITGLFLVVAATTIYHIQNPFVAKVARLSGYGWRFWPPFLRLEPTIEEVYLAQNRFETLPVVVLNLPNLRVLNASENQITVLPSTLSHLSRLERLYLAKNRLRALPWGLENLHRLQVVDLSHNELTEVPLEFLELPRLERLDLRGNPLSERMRRYLATHPRRSAFLW